MIVPRKPKFCPYREKPCREDCIHFLPGGMDVSRFCMRDSGVLIARELSGSLADLASYLGAVVEAIEKAGEPKI